MPFFDFKCSLSCGTRGTPVAGNIGQPPSGSESNDASQEDQNEQQPPSPSGSQEPEVAEDQSCNDESNRILPAGPSEYPNNNTDGVRNSFYPVTQPPRPPPTVGSRWKKSASDSNGQLFRTIKNNSMDGAHNMVPGNFQHQGQIHSSVADYLVPVQSGSSNGQNDDLDDSNPSSSNRMEGLPCGFFPNALREPLILKPHSSSQNSFVDFAMPETSSNSANSGTPFATFGINSLINQTRSIFQDKDITAGSKRSAHQTACIHDAIDDIQKKRRIENSEANDASHQTPLLSDVLQLKTGMYTKPSIHEMDEKLKENKNKDGTFHVSNLTIGHGEFGHITFLGYIETNLEEVASIIDSVVFEKGGVKIQKSPGKIILVTLLNVTRKDFGTPYGIDEVDDANLSAILEALYKQYKADFMQFTENEKTWMFMLRVQDEKLDSSNPSPSYVS